MNEEFDLGADLGMTAEDLVPELVPTKPGKEKAVKKSAPVAAPSVVETVQEVVEAFIDPEDDRENWPTIRIESEEGKPNYEYVSAHGTKQNGDSFGHELQIMRGVDVKVPPSIVHTLMDAVSTHIFMRRDPITGRNIQDRQDRTACPWRLVRGGKYF